MALQGIGDPSTLSLRVVAPTLTPRFREQVAALGGALTETAMRGVHVGELSGFALRVVETGVVWPHPHEHLLFAVSPACVDDPGRVRTFDDRELELYYRLMQGIAKLARDPTWKAIMKDATLVENATTRALRDLLAVLPPEMRLEGLNPVERLSGLKPQEVLHLFKPEERLSGLGPEEQLLALSDDVLRTLPAAYPATLSDDTQSIIRERLAR